MAKQPDPLFPDLPEDLTALSDEDLAALLQEHEHAAELIDKDDPDYTKDMEADEVLAAYEQGVEQIEAIRSEQHSRLEAQAAYADKKAALAERRKAKAEEEAADEVVAEAEEITAEASERQRTRRATSETGRDAPAVEEQVLWLPQPRRRRQEKKEEVRMRKPPQPTGDRMPNGTAGAVMTAAAGVEGVRVGGVITDRMDLANAMKKTADRWGRIAKHEGGVEQRILIANATYPFPEDRKLHASDWQANSHKIEKVIPTGIPGLPGMSLTASGGLCAPLEPIYSMPNFASMARPVRDALPGFAADRGGVNVPTATYIADITSAITVIEEAADALGGTYATKSCQDLECPEYTEVPVTVISHCREYGNLNSMAWPEKIAHENDLTMAAHARTAEHYLLDRIKSLSLNVTAANVIGAYADLVYAVTRAKSGIRYRLRMDQGATFRALFPAWLPDLLVADTAATPFDRFQNQAAMSAHLGSYGIAVTYYLDDVTGDTSQAFAAEAAAALWMISRTRCSGRSSLRASSSTCRCPAWSLGSSGTRRSTRRTTTRSSVSRSRTSHDLAQRRARCGSGTRCARLVSSPPPRRRSPANHG